MFRRERRNLDVRVLVDHTWLDFVCVDLISLRNAREAEDLRVSQPRFDIDAVCLDDVVGHRFDAGGPEHLERNAPRRRGAED